jgi:hypothetical protein
MNMNDISHLTLGLKIKNVIWIYLFWRPFSSLLISRQCPRGTVDVCVRDPIVAPVAVGGGVAAAAVEIAGERGEPSRPDGHLGGGGGTAAG